MKTDRSALATLFVSLVIIMLGFGIAIPLMPFFVLHFGASGLALGVLMALYSLMQFLFAPMWGRLSDRIGRKPVLLIGVGGYAISFALQAVAPNLLLFGLARTLAGIISSAALPTAMAYVADTTSAENRARGVGLLGAAMGLGMIFGPLLGGLLTHVALPLPAGLMQTTVDPSTGQVIHLSTPFFFSALLALVDALFIYLLLSESLPQAQRTTAPAAGRSRTGQLWAGLRGPSGFLYTLAFLLAFALANMEAVLALYGQQRFGMGPAAVGMVMGGMGVISVLQLGVVIGPLTRKVGEVRVIQGGLAVSVAGFFALALAATAPLMVAGALLFTAGNVLLQPSVTALISCRTLGGQGEAMGLNNSYQSLGRGIGPLWAGFAFDLYTTLAFWTGALLQLAALALSLRFLDPAQAESIPTTAPVGTPVVE